MKALGKGAAAAGAAYEGAKLLKETLEMSKQKVKKNEELKFERKYNELQPRLPRKIE